MKKNPTGIRFNQEKLEFIQKKYPSLNTPQKVVTFLLNAFWWKHHPDELADQSQFAFVEERRKNMPEHIKEKVKQKFDQLDAQAEAEKGEVLPMDIPEPVEWTEKDKADFNAIIDKEIEKILQEKIPAHRNTAIGRKAWDAERRQRIEVLKAQKV